MAASFESIEKRMHSVTKYKLKDEKEIHYLLISFTILSVCL